MKVLKELSNFIISKGIPVYNGLAEGKAIIIKSSIDFPKIQNESEKVMLVVNNFNPNYDILLNKCFGVISELGNILCHLAIVTRIKKIPAIVNAKNIISKIKDGENITIDAYNGILYRGLHVNSLSFGDRCSLIRDFYSKIYDNNF